MNRQIGRTKSTPPIVRGVIDSLEEGWARIALDDEQRLDWPADRLPEGAAEGLAVVLQLTRPREAGVQGVMGAWQGIVAAQAQAEDQRLSIQLGSQTLYWPAAMRFSPGDPVIVRMETDADDTQRRRERVRGLIDDLFG